VRWRQPRGEEATVVTGGPRSVGRRSRSAEPRDVDELRAAFTWEQARGWLDGLPGGQGVLCPLFAAFDPEPIRQRLQLGSGRVLVTSPWRCVIEPRRVVGGGSIAERPHPRCGPPSQRRAPRRPLPRHRRPPTTTTGAVNRRPAAVAGTVALVLSRRGRDLVRPAEGRPPTGEVRTWTAREATFEARAGSCAIRRPPRVRWFDPTGQHVVAVAH
jgi:hypothetical protein